VDKLKPTAEGGLPERLIQKALEHWIQTELSDFADQLDTARVMWRKYRELVEAPDFPEPFRAAFVAEYHCEPDDQDSIVDTALAPDLRERLLPEAIETARFWALREQGATEADANMLMKLGISLC
jgi:hypothetical protein